MSNDSNDRAIPEELRKAVSKIFSEPQDKIEIIRIILELQNEAIKDLKKRVEKLEQFQEEQRNKK